MRQHNVSNVDVARILTISVAMPETRDVLRMRS